MDNKLLSLSESRQNGHWVEGPETLLRVILGPNLLKSLGQIFKPRQNGHSAEDLEHFVLKIGDSRAYRFCCFET